MIAHSKAAGHAPRQGAPSGNCSGFSASWLDLVDRWWYQRSVRRGGRGGGDA
ncbi:hypothetical protein SGL43_04568 [Streptomyces globisporus]|uniref:Trp operon leader peptide n=1 Tax=Streptomyces globisporus TaxID=1908 RepID=A0ABM9H1P0_STRGL|nr:hypothetical protein SGL43_04568 [Streptomyces globisporus]